MFLFIQKSKLGQQMPAVAQNRTGAALQGIDIHVTAAIATCLACGMAALTGSLMATLFSLFFSMGVLALVRVFTNITGGYAGLSGIPPLLGMSKTPYYYLILSVTLLCLAVNHRLEFSRIGLNWKAVAKSHLLASSIGINETWQRIICLSIGGLFAGVASGFYAHYYLILSQDTFSLFTSIYLFIYMMMGGVDAFIGSIVGTAVLILIPEVFRGLREYVPFLFAGILLLVLFFMPRGLAGLPQQMGAWVLGKAKGEEK